MCGKHAAFLGVLLFALLNCMLVHHVGFAMRVDVRAPRFYPNGRYGRADLHPLIELHESVGDSSNLPGLPDVWPVKNAFKSVLDQTHSALPTLAKGSKVWLCIQSPTSSSHLSIQLKCESIE